MRKKGKKVIRPAGDELMDYLNRGFAICNRCGAVMDRREDPRGGCDIVIGITGDETIGDHVLLHLGHMIFGQFLVWGPLVIRCVPDEDAQSLYLKGENDADH